MLSSLLPEILYEIALHLPLPEDVVSLSLTCHAVRGALSTPALFKARLILQGWNIEAWKYEDDKKRPSVDWKRLIRMDYIHSKILRLLEGASTGGLLPLVKSGSFSLPPDIVSHWFEKNEAPELRTVHNTFIHFGKAEAWSQRMSKVFPILIVHHRQSNILHIMEAKYCDAFRTYLMVVAEIFVDMLAHSHWHSHWRYDDECLSRSSVGLQERACFGLAALVMQCDTKTIESFFGDRWTGGSPDFVADLFSTLEYHATALFRIVSFERHGALTDIVGASIQYSACFLIQMKIHLELQFAAARRPLSLLPPSIPSMNPASQDDELFELGSDDISWPWLRDGLAGTPIARLSSVSGDIWAGYYTNRARELPDRAMFFTFDLVPHPAVNGAAHKIYFLGEGEDSAGSFSLEGSIDTHTGVVTARKTYVGTHWWSWNGLVTPFGMVGVWGTDTQTLGWWWIWPQEWSERSSAS